MAVVAATGSPCPTCQMVGSSCLCISIASTFSNAFLTYQASSLLAIHNKNQERIFSIDEEGNIYFGLEQLKIDDEKELALGFMLVISELTGISFLNKTKDKFISEMIQHFREKQLNKIL